MMPGELIKLRQKLMIRERIASVGYLVIEIK